MKQLLEFEKPVQKLRDELEALRTKAASKPSDKLTAQIADLEVKLDKLQRGLTLLPEKLRAALILVTMEGLSQKECADVLGCSIRGVEGRVHRARQMLLEWWEEEK